MRINKPSLKLIFSSVILIACGSPSDLSESENTDSTAPFQSTEIDLPSESTFKFDLIIANNIAAPVKLLTDISNAGVDNYQADITNPISRAASYATSDEKALGFGVYGADLSYKSIYQKNDEMADYLIVIRKLSEDLGLSNLFDQEAIQKFESIKSNPDSVRIFIFNKYDQADAFLRSNDRLTAAALILTGGLVESLHIVSEQIEAGDASKDAYMIFLQQKNTLKNLLDLFESLERDGQNIKVKKDIELLHDKFKEVDSFEMFSKEKIHELHVVVDQVRNKLV